MKKYIAELVGTFLLALTVNLSLAGKFPVPTAVAAAIIVGACVYTMGAISGMHINPSITLGLLSVRKISLKDAGAYLVSQFAGAFLAMLTAQSMVPGLTRAPAADSASIFLYEGIGTFVLAFGIAGVAFGKASADVSGLLIGGSLVVGASIAGTGANGAINPAVALSIGSFSLTYALAPIVGAVIANQLYSVLEKP